MKELENNDPKRNQPEFNVPDGYFLSSASSIQNKIEWQEEHKEYTILKSINKKHGFDLPSGYLKSNESKLELLEYANLKSLRDTSVFSIPTAYFENSQPVLISSITKQETIKPAGAKIISISFKRTVYALAAMLLVVLSVYTYNSLSPGKADLDCGTIACVDKAEVLKSKNIEALEEEDLYELVNSQELEKNLQLNKKPLMNNDSAEDLNIDDFPDEI